MELYSVRDKNALFRNVEESEKEFLDQHQLFLDKTQSQSQTRGNLFS